MRVGTPHSIKRFAMHRTVYAPRLNPIRKILSPGLVVIDDELVAVSDIPRDPAARD